MSFIISSWVLYMVESEDTTLLFYMFYEYIKKLPFLHHSIISNIYILKLHIPKSTFGLSFWQ